MQGNNGQNNPEKIYVGISSCLLGDEVRYDGGHKYTAYIAEDLGEYFNFIPFCPEVDIGLGVPREPIHLVATVDGIRCIGVKTTGLDATGRLSRCADSQKHWQGSISGYILKKGSPSCGMERVKLLRNGCDELTGVGIFASRMMHNFPLLPIEDEIRLGDSTIREDFIRRVLVYHRSSRLCASGLPQE